MEKIFHLSCLPSRSLGEGWSLDAPVHVKPRENLTTKDQPSPNGYGLAGTKHTEAT